jgi:hypothetical protein
VYGFDFYLHNNLRTNNAVQLPPAADFAIARANAALKSWLVTGMQHESCWPRSAAEVECWATQMDVDTHTFCAMIRNRSDENRRAMHCFSTLHGVLSPAFSILRQELDSMIRMIYLLKITDPVERQRLIRSTLHGERWR